MGKSDTIILIHPNGDEVPFKKVVADRIMKMELNGGWKWKVNPNQDQEKAKTNNPGSKKSDPKKA